MPLGALITVQIQYSCDLDKNADSCEPVYEFTRVDKKDDPVSKGEGVWMVYGWSMDGHWMACGMVQMAVWVVWEGWHEWQAIS